MSDSRVTELSEDRAARARQRSGEGAGPVRDPGAGHPLLRLQRQVGNAQVARMIAQREAAEEDELQATHDPALAQREGEEEELQATHDPALAQREGEEEEELQATHDPALAQRAPDEEELQAKPEVGLEGGPVSDRISSQIESSRGGGSALDDGMRSSMEHGFGTSFDGVRVHSDSNAAQLNRSISAKAFTTGNDIFLGPGQSASDSHLMAHELTHVVQQKSMPGSGGGMSVGAAGDSYEQDADRQADAVLSGAAQRHMDEAQE